MALENGEADAMIDVLATHVIEEVWNHDGINSVEGVIILRAVVAQINASVDQALKDHELERERKLCEHNEPYNGEHCRRCAQDEIDLNRAGL